MINITEQAAEVGWAPDADAINAPRGTLLRADNLVKDERGVLALRRGYTTLYESLTGGEGTTGVDSLYSAELPNPDPDGTTYDVAVSGEKLWINGTDQGVVLDGSGDAAICDDAYQIFIARETSKYKWDGSQLHNWSIAAPSGAPTLASNTALSLLVWEFDASEGTIAGTSTVHEGTGVLATGYDGTASGCYELTPTAASGRASISKAFTSVTDCYNIPGTTGSDTDLIDFYVYLEEPRKVDKVTVMFGLNPTGDPFLTDYYKFSFNIKDGGAVDVKDPTTSAIAGYSSYASRSIAAVSPSEKTKSASPTEVAKVLKRIGRHSGPRAKVRDDASQTSPAWTHFTVTRGQFERIGGTSGLDWKVVKSVKLVYTAVPGSTDKVRLDDMKIIGGGERVLNGTFRAIYRFVHDTGNYIELSPPSPESDPIVLNQQALSITIPAASINAADAQVNQIWIYLFGGFLDQYYRVTITSSENSSTMGLNEFDPSADGTISAGDRMRWLVTQFNPGDAPPSTITATVRKSELDILLDNETLEPGGMGIPDNLVAIAGPWRSRLFLVTDEGYVYPTSQTSPSNCNSYHVLDLRRYGDPMWAVKTNGGIYVGLTKDVVRIGGSGDETEDRLTADLYPEPLNVGNPPIDRCVYTDGNSVMYRSADGMMALNGVSVTPVNQGATSLLWRGYNRHGVSAINMSGRFRAVTDNGILYLLVTEGSSTDPTSLWRVNFGAGDAMWSRTTYPETLLSLFRSKDGRLLAGTRAGEVLQLETGTQDDGADIAIDMRWPWLDGGNPLTRKVPLDFQIHAHTGNDTADLKFYVDGDVGTAYSYEFATSADTQYRLDMTGVPGFIRIQPRISGSFGTFLFRMLNITTRPLVQHAVTVDTDYLIPAEPNDMLWLQEIEIDCISPSDLTLILYIDDVLYTTQTVPVTDNVRSVYVVPLPRGTKGRRPRIVIKTTAGDGIGQLGFECFRVRYRARGSGNMVEVPFNSAVPVGQ